MEASQSIQIMINGRGNQISGKALLWIVEGVEENRCECSCLHSKFILEAQNLK